MNMLKPKKKETKAEKKEAAAETSEASAENKPAGKKATKAPAKKAVAINRSAATGVRLCRCRIALKINLFALAFQQMLGDDEPLDLACAFANRAEF